jgi:ankyrin repeat protein
MMMAAKNGHLKFIKILAMKGTSICLTSDQGVTPLPQAALYGHQEVVDYLMSYRDSRQGLQVLWSC